MILGVWIETGENVSSGDRKRAEWLEETLQAEAIIVEPRKSREPSIATANEATLALPIHILVGEKP